MKKRNILRHVFLGLGILASGSMIGLNSASADTLKDSNGNPVKYNKSYYLEPKNYPGHGISHTYWNLGQWGYLDKNKGLPIKIVHESEDTKQKHVSDGSSINIQMQSTKPHFSYLCVSKVYNGIQLRSYNGETDIWKAENFSASDKSVTFKNEYTNKYFHYRTPGGWLDANHRTYAKKILYTQWRIVPIN